MDAINLGTDAYQADGDGKFDLEFAFNEAQANRYNQGESQPR